MKAPLTDGFLTADKRALSSILLGLRNGVEVFHDHTEPSAQIPLAQVPVFGADQTKLKDGGFEDLALKPFNGRVGSSLTFTFVGGGVEVDPNLSITLTSLPFQVAAMCVLQVEEYVDNATSVQLIVKLRVDGVANAMRTLTQGDRGLSHSDTFNIASGTHTIGVQYQAVAGATLIGLRTLTLIAWKGSI